MWRMPCGCNAGEGCVMYGEKDHACMYGGLAGPGVITTAEKKKKTKTKGRGHRSVRCFESRVSPPPPPIWQWLGLGV